MSCAQVMYQPYAPSPYVVQPDTPQAAPPHPSGSTNTPGGDSRHGEGVLHHPQQQQPTATTSITPHTPPHAHHHHHHQTTQPPPPPPQQQPLPQPQIQPSGEPGGSSGQVQQQQQAQQTSQPPPQQQQQQQGTSDPSGGQRPLPRAPYRAASNGSAAGDTDAPPPEKKFCPEAEPTSVTPTPSLPHPHHQQHQQASHHHHHHQQQHHHHHHHHHHPHHHPPHTEPPPPSPTQEANEVKYVSANCMVVTHYAGDTASVVDEHFSRALSTPHYEKPHSPGKASSPMSSRNFPPSFWNSNYQVPSSSSSSSSSSRPPSLAGHLAAASPAELYDPYHGGLHSLQPPAPDPWAAYSLSSQAYGHRSMAHDVYQAAMSVPSSSRPYHQYSSLSFQPHLARIPGVTAVGSQMSMGKPESWGARYHEFANPELAAHGLDNTYSTAHYPNVPGLETGVPQEGAKDLYWF